jgi:hypothetical protein
MSSKVISVEKWLAISRLFKISDHTEDLDIRSVSQFVDNEPRPMLVLEKEKQLRS